MFRPWPHRLLASCLILVFAALPSFADTILVFKGGDNPVNLTGAVTLTFEGEILKVYANKTDAVIKDLHFKFDPPNRDVGFLTDAYFDDFDSDPKGVLYSAYADKKPGIPKDEVFSISIRGVFPKDTKALITPTATGRVPEPASLLLTATALAIAALLRVRPVKRQTCAS